jgi:hypothetical protein
MLVAVDLHVVERQMLEVVVRAEAGAEVVEREAAAHAAEDLGEAARLVHVADQGGLRDLDHEVVRVH